MSTGAGLDPAWQNNPKAVEEVLLKYAASLYYMIHFDELRTHIRLWIASWYFLDKVGKKESNYQDEMVIKELNRYRSLLDGFMRFRKSKNDSVKSTADFALKADSFQRNEIPDSASESTT
jgi:hypothetical protein